MKLIAGLRSSLGRQFPLAALPRRGGLEVLAARGERVAMQACFRFDGLRAAEVSATARAAGDLPLTVRRVGTAPVPHHNTNTAVEELDGVGHVPGYVPDPLFPETTARFAPGLAHTFWISLDVPRDLRPGRYGIRIELSVKEGPPARLKAALRVAEPVLQARRDIHVTHWFYADALCDWYKVQPFEAAFWSICEKYMRNYAGHGLDTIYVPVFTPPLDGVKRPTQLLGVRRRSGPLGVGATASYEFDWSDVRKWVRLAGRCGIERFEWTHLFTQWGVERAIRIYEDPADEGTLLWKPETGATSPTYRRFLSQFLPALQRFLQAERLLERSYFHVSDEPHAQHLDNYRAARGMLAELAPWIKVMDALSDVNFGRQHLTDLPVPSISTTKQFVDEGIPCWTYFCCGPRGPYLNRLLDTPLAKIRMAGWLFQRFGVGGFLHWGYNYWYKGGTRQLIDPFATNDGLAWPGWAHGDPFVVYPGPAEIGPIDSIRWEVFAQSLQDYALLQTLGVERESGLLAPLHDFNEFPKTERWIEQARRKLLLS